MAILPQPYAESRNLERKQATLEPNRKVGENRMKDYFLRVVRQYVGPNLNFWRIRFKGVGTKKRNILLVITLVLCMRLFFYNSSHDLARAERAVPSKVSVSEAIDPLEKIKTGEGMASLSNSTSDKVCRESDAGKIAPPFHSDKDENKDKDRYMALVSSYPIAAMVPFLSEIDKKAAPFLIAIAKKESDWGNHAPRKNGRDCYNYWGYKGGYNPTAGGYSCFDSPEQAVKTVGGRLGDLIGKKINTPEKMVVWKCGGDCSGDAGAGGWIGTVRQYWQKLDS